MIYLLRVSDNKVDANGNEYPVYCLKICYAETIRKYAKDLILHDDCFPGLLRLYGTIPDGTLSDFDFITNNYLSDYRYDVSRNFFEYRYKDEVINFFSTYTTHDSLQALQNPKP